MTERSLLADAVATLFSARCTPETVAEIEAGADARGLWDEVEGLGLTLASVPEAAGGEGGSLVDSLTVLRSAGRHAVPLPLAESGILAGWILAEAGLQVPHGPATVAPTGRGERLHIALDADGATLSGRARRVPWAGAADRIVVLAHADDERLYAAIVDPDTADVLPGRSLSGEPRDSVSFDGVRLEPAAFARAPIDLETYFLRGALGRAVLMLGALEQVRDLTVAFSKDREQFGKPLARFQAVQHLLAQLARDVAMTRAAVELAATAAAEDVAGAWLEIASAKVVANRTAGTVAAQAHQVHGAIGVTKEYSLSVLTRRLWTWRDEFGTESEWSTQIAERAWRTPGGVWGLVTSGRIPLDAVRTA